MWGPAEQRVSHSLHNCLLERHIKQRTLIVSTLLKDTLPKTTGQLNEQN